jgi:hypothetical protein
MFVTYPEAGLACTHSSVSWRYVMEGYNRMVEQLQEQVSQILKTQDVELLPYL